MISAPEPSAQQDDSLATTITVICPGQEDRTDIFIYSDEGLCLLERHVTLRDGERAADVRLAPGGKLLLAVSGLDATFNETAMGTFQSAEQLALPYSEALVAKRISSACAAFEAGECPDVHLSPLFASIRLEMVANDMEGYDLLEDPEVYVSCAASTVEVFREKGFFPSGNIPRTQGAKLPCDVGMFAQRPGIVLTCFPDESGLASLVLECTISGERRTFSQKLPPLPRGALASVDIHILSPSSSTFHLTLL